MRATFALLSLLLLAACDRGGSIMRETSPAVFDAAAAAPAGGPPAFVGVWAASAAQCARAPWRLSPTRITTPDGLDCRIGRMDATMAGYTLQGACGRGGPALPDRIVATLSAGGTPRMTLSDGPFREPVSLVRCPGASLTAAG